ncbi:hypothetical protein [Tritonibacter scottomollicae]|uniref:Uncharacterized protein n=1 Tax=Tritonibacter scottomollicae TaxID=483013 RepID=A0A2T1A5E1_TRISK|nr:hypothetical protein [Tritonibacter scottomollicae]PRZ43806.1 hypothetical protein CLV89_1264 [Tritonibacter scottomollicae]
MTVRYEASVLPLYLFFGILIVVTASDLLVLTIPIEFARYSFDGTPNNTIASYIVTSSGLISHFGLLVLMCLVPMVITAFLPRTGTKRAAQAASAALLLCLCAGIALMELAHPVPVSPFSAILALISASLALLTTIAPICAAIWISATIGTPVLTRATIVLSGAIVVLSALLTWGISVPYSDHYAFVLYTFVFAVTFRSAPRGLRLWGGLLVATWLVPFVFAWAPELVQASMITYAPTRLDAYLAVLAQSPPPPRYGVPIIPLLLGAMLLFSDTASRQITHWLAVLFGAIILAYASVLAFDPFVYYPVQIIESIRSGALTLGGAIMSALIWLVLFIAPFAMGALSVHLYRTVPLRPA